jgi:branched-chain amino acid transport system permease protein
MQPYGVYNVRYEQDMAIIRTKQQWACAIAFLIFLLFIPLFFSSYIISVFNTLCIVIVACTGLQVLLGYAGQISLAQSAFLGLGAYTYALLMTRLSMPFWLAMICSGVLCAIIGIFFGLPSLRLKGFYLAIVSVAAQYLIVYFVIHLPNLTGGVMGMIVPEAKIGTIVFNSEGSQWYLIMPITAIMLMFAKNLGRSRVGRALIAIKDNDIAAEIMGVNVFLYKVAAFAYCSFYAGFAGSLWGMHEIMISSEQFTLMDSIWYLAILIVGGLGSIAGVVFGTIFLNVLREFINIFTPIIAGFAPSIGKSFFAVATYGLFGIIIAMFLIFEPRGLAHRWELIKVGYRLWPFSHMR